VVHFQVTEGGALWVTADRMSSWEINARRQSRPETGTDGAGIRLAVGWDRPSWATPGDNPAEPDQVGSGGAGQAGVPSA